MVTSKTQRHHLQNSTLSLPKLNGITSRVASKSKPSVPKFNGITSMVTSKVHRHHFQNSTLALPKLNGEWIRTTKTAWSESTETATANQTLLVPANMYIIQLHTWECVLLNKLVQTLCLWNNLCIIDCIAGVTLLDHLLWKHRSLESCVHLSTFQVDVLYVWLETHGLQIQNTFWNKHTNSDYHLKASGWQNSVLRRIACISSIDERKMAWSFVVESLLVRSFSIKNDCIWLYRMFFSLSPPKIDSLSLKSWGWHLLPSLMAWHRHLQSSYRRRSSNAVHGLQIQLFVEIDWHSQGTKEEVCICKGHPSWAYPKAQRKREEIMVE